MFKIVLWGFKIWYTFSLKYVHWVLNYNFVLKELLCFVSDDLFISIASEMNGAHNASVIARAQSTSEERVTVVVDASLAPRRDLRHPGLLRGDVYSIINIVIFKCNVYINVIFVCLGHGKSGVTIRLWFPLKYRSCTFPLHIQIEDWLYFAIYILLWYPRLCQYDHYASSHERSSVQRQCSSGRRVSHITTLIRHFAYFTSRYLTIALCQLNNVYLNNIWDS